MITRISGIRKWGTSSKCFEIAIYFSSEKRKENLRIYLQFPSCSPSFEFEKMSHGKSKCSAILTSFSLTPLSAFLASLYISFQKNQYFLMSRDWADIEMMMTNSNIYFPHWNKSLVYLLAIFLECFILLSSH